MTSITQPAATLPMYGMPGMAPQMMAPQMMAPMGQPVYISSLSQLPPGAVAVSNPMLGQALGQSNIGAQVVQPRTSPLMSMLKGAALGGAAGAAFGLIPFLPLGLVSGGLVGAGVGAAIGLVRGLAKRKAEGEYHTMQQQAAAQAQMNASTPPGARNLAGEVPAVAEPKKKGVVMGPEMRKKWAAKVRAERAEAAKTEK